MGSLIQLAIYAALIGAFVFGVRAAWMNFTGRYIAEGAATQLAADQKVLATVKLRADTAEGQRDQEKGRAEKAEGETASCVSGTQEQNKAIDERTRLRDEALKRTHAEAESAKAEIFRTRTEMARLAAYAAATPAVNQSCADTLSKTDTILRDQARARRALGIEAPK